MRAERTREQLMTQLQNMSQGNPRAYNRLVLQLIDHVLMTRGGCCGCDLDNLVNLVLNPANLQELSQETRGAWR